MKKIYIVRKYVLANSAPEAIRKEKKQAVDDCYTEDKSLERFIEDLTPKTTAKMGFRKNKNEEENK